jgi:hypothetical protein
VTRCRVDSQDSLGPMPSSTASGVDGSPGSPDGGGGPAYMGLTPYEIPKEQELKWLEDHAHMLETMLAEMRRRLDDLKKAGDTI